LLKQKGKLKVNKETELHDIQRRKHTRTQAEVVIRIHRSTANKTHRHT